MAQKKESNKAAKVATVGLGIAVAAAAAAGLYFLYGKDGEKNRKKLKGWMVKAKGEVMERMEKLKDVNEAAYHAVVDAVLSKYRHIEEKEVGQLARELKGHWKNIKKHLSEDDKPAKKKTARKSPAKKKAAKKAA